MIRLLSVFLVLVASVACSPNQNDEKKAESLTEINKPDYVHLKAYRKLSSKIKFQKRASVLSFLEANDLLTDFNGSFLVAQNGQVIYEYYAGYSDFEKKTKITKSTSLHLASISKVLTATAIFRLIEQNKFGLDDKVNTILPSFPYDTITIRMLLNHRSGIPNYAYFASQKDVWNQSKALTNENMLDLLVRLKLPLIFKPDTKFVYNNSNYAILALVVEKKSGMPFPKAMKSLVFDPIGMKHTFIFELSKDSIRVSQSYKSTFEKVPFNFLDAIYGDKNCYSTPRDIMLYDLAMRNNMFVSKGLKKEIFKGYSYEKLGVKNYGLGIRLKEWGPKQRLFYHQGWWHGNTSSYVTLRKENVVIIALSNKYSRKVYQTMRIAALFGDYPFEIQPRKNSKSDTTELSIE